MTAANYTITCEQGAAFNLVVTWKDSSGNAINNTGYTAKMQVRQELNVTPVATLTTEDSQIILGGSNGQITLKLSTAETVLIEPADYYYDLELADGSGEITRVLEGVFSVKAQITHS